MSNAEKPRFCKDCQHFKGYECTHPKGLQYDLVNGDRLYVDPQEVRSENGVCGPYGVLFYARRDAPPTGVDGKSAQELLDEARKRQKQMHIRTFENSPDWPRPRPMC
jgi:hypothetical protein